MNKLDKKLSALKMNVEKEYKPLGDISLAIIKASSNCFEYTKPSVKGSNEKEIKKNEILVYYDFIYFFMHLTMRMASSKLIRNQFEKLQECLGPFISQTAINSFFQDWPEESKSKMLSNFFDGLNAAELDYSESKEFMVKDDLISGNSLLAKLSSKIAELSGNGTNLGTMMKVKFIAANEYMSMDLDKLIVSASHVL